MFYRVWLGIKGSPVLYKIFLMVRGKYQPGFFPDASFNLHLAGYQRSGNTFTQRLLARLAPNIKVASHVHSIATMKLAMKFDVPIVCLIRNPSEAVASSYVKNIDSGKSKYISMVAIHEYVDYYEFVLKNRDKMAICVFEKTLKNPTYFLDKVSAQINISFDRDEIYVAEKYVINDLKADSCNGKTLPTNSSNWTNAKKEKRKKIELECLKKQRKYRRAVELYELLCS